MQVNSILRHVMKEVFDSNVFREFLSGHALTRRYKGDAIHEKGNYCREVYVRVAKGQLLKKVLRT